jgi:dTDP-4-dehydrorhamnose reductase
MRVLIVGVTGMLGHSVFRELASSHEVTGTCRGSYADRQALHGVVARERCLDQLDARDEEGLGEALRLAAPDCVVNCAGVVKQATECSDAEIAIEVNALLPHRLARLCRERGARLIHVSTDCVFSGARGGYAPGDPPDPVDVYGRSKLLGELAPPHLTLRTSLIGRELSGSRGLVEWLLSQRGGRVEGFVNVRFSGLTTRALGRILGRVISQHPGLAGVHHVAAAPIAKHDLLVALSDRMDLRIQITPTPEPRCDRSLDGRGFVEETGIRAPSWEEMLDELSADSECYEDWRGAA